MRGRSLELDVTSETSGIFAGGDLTLFDLGGAAFSLSVGVWIRMCCFLLFASSCDACVVCGFVCIGWFVCSLGVEVVWPSLVLVCVCREWDSLLVAPARLGRGRVFISGGWCLDVYIEGGLVAKGIVLCSG